MCQYDFDKIVPSSKQNKTKVVPSKAYKLSYVDKQSCDLSLLANMDGLPAANESWLNIIWLSIVLQISLHDN